MAPPPPRRDRPAEAVAATGHSPAPPRGAPRWPRFAGLAPALAFCALLFPGEREHVHAAVATLANLLASYGFASTLLPGREPLISRYTRFAHDGRPPPYLARYTRRLTVCWAMLLAGFATAQAAALAGLWPPNAVLAVEAAAGGALFLGEHLARPFLFPQHGPATLRQTFRAVRLAHAAEARGAG